MILYIYVFGHLMSSGSSQPCDHPRDSNSHCSFEVLENGNFDGFDHWETVIFDVMQMGFLPETTRD